LYKNTSLGLALESSYGNYFKSSLTSTSKETIFGIRGGANNTPEKLNYPIATTGGASGICPSQNLVDAYETLNGFTYDTANPYANRDPRFAASIVYNGATWNNRTILQAAGDKDDQANANASRTGYYLKKFLTDNLNLVQGTTEQHTWPVYRYGEFLLEYAEALNQACGPDGLSFTLNGTNYTAPITAKAALALVRKRASPSLQAVTTTDLTFFDTAIKHERQVELAFEDYRYWDLLRWTTAETELIKPIKGVKITKINTGTDIAPVWVYS
jgi:starch-binding outer membrane protein, SusD/RagB family